MEEIPPRQTADKPVDFFGGFFVRFGFPGVLNGCEVARRSCGGQFSLAGDKVCDLLDVLGGCGDQALERDLGQTSEAGVSVTVQLFDVGE